jgi:hypothetical protein
VNSARVKKEYGGGVLWVRSSGGVCWKFEQTGSLDDLDPAILWGEQAVAATHIRKSEWERKKKKEISEEKKDHYGDRRRRSYHRPRCRP